MFKTDPPSITFVAMNSDRQSVTVRVAPDGSLSLDDGTPVSREFKGSYYFILGAMKFALRSDDPNAP